MSENYAGDGNSDFNFDDWLDTSFLTAEDGSGTATAAVSSTTNERVRTVKDDSVCPDAISEPSSFPTSNFLPGPVSTLAPADTILDFDEEMARIDDNVARMGNMPRSPTDQQVSGLSSYFNDETIDHAFRDPSEYAAVDNSEQTRLPFMIPNLESAFTSPAQPFYGHSSSPQY